jgi:hypothetical protein
LTDPSSQPVARGPLHPVTRIGRVLQQIRSFTTLHASELDGLAAELEAGGQPGLAARLRVFQSLHSQEASMIADELADVQAELDRDGLETRTPATAPRTPATTPQTASAGPDVDPALIDHAANSPKRARWLAEQARQAEEARRPRTRREIFGG